jgi:hypothetical protein
LAKERKPDSSGNYLCPRCDRWLGPAAFYPAAQTKAGISSWCKECLRSYQTFYNERAQERKGLPATPARRRNAVAKRLEQYVDLEVLLRFFEDGGGLPEGIFDLMLSPEEEADRREFESRMRKLELERIAERNRELGLSE